MLKDLYYI